MTYAERRAKYVAYLGSKCVACGETENLQFDHVNPSEKNFRIGGSVFRKEAVVLKELDLCQLLCEVCHLSKTLKEQKTRNVQYITPHGSASTYNNRGCRCQECRTAWAKYYKKRRRSTAQYTR